MNYYEAIKNDGAEPHHFQESWQHGVHTQVRKEDVLFKRKYFDQLGKVRFSAWMVILHRIIFLILVLK